MVSIIIAIIVFSVLILTHELGHFLFAKKCGIGVIEFSIGMGPRILSREYGGTRYSIKCIPFGGSCMMVGEDEENPSEDAFGNKPVLSRILVVAGGPLFNILTAAILSIIIIAGVGANPAVVYQVYPGYSAEEAGIQLGDVITSVNGHKIHVGRDLALLTDADLAGDTVTVTYLRDGERCTAVYDPLHTSYRLGISYYADETDAVLGEISEGTAAYEAGLQEGDRVTAIDGTTIHTGLEIQEYFLENPPDGTPISMEIVRDGTAITVEVIPTYYEANSLGFAASYYREKVGPMGALKGAVQEVGYWARYTLMSLRMLLTGQVAVSDMSGPVGIVSAISQTVESSTSDGIFYVIMNVLNFSVLLSVNLGIVNLLPLPALDGGRLVFLILEAIRRKPVDPEKEGMVHAAGFALLMVLMVFILYNDILRIITG